MIGLITSSIEDGQDTVSGEIVDNAAGGFDHRHDGSPIRVEHFDDLSGRVLLTEGGEASEVSEQDADFPLLAAEPRETGIAPQLLADEGWQVRAEQVIEPRQFACRGRQQPDLLFTCAFTPEVIENVVGRRARRTRPGNARDGIGVPSINAGECRVRIQTPERGRHGPTAAVLISGTESDGGEGDEHEQMPRPPGHLPVVTEDDGDRRLGKQRVCSPDGYGQDAAALAVDGQVSPRGDCIGGDGHQCEHFEGASRLLH